MDILAYNVYVGIYDWLDGKFSYEKAIEMLNAAEYLAGLIRDVLE